MFDEESSITASKGLWLFNQNVELTSDGCLTDKCGFFNSTAESKLELAYFSNAMDRFEQFSVRLFFKRSAGVSGELSLVDNSECTIDRSVVARCGALGDFESTISKAEFSIAVSFLIVLNVKKGINIRNYFVLICLPTCIQPNVLKIHFILAKHKTFQMPQNYRLRIKCGRIKNSSLYLQ